KRDADEPAVALHRRNNCWSRAAIECSKSAAACDQLSSFRIDEVEILRLTQRQIAAFEALPQLAFADTIRRRADDLAGLNVAQRRRQVESVREQVITEQDAVVIAPARVGGGDMAACAGLIQHIVMHERRGMNQFDDGRQNWMLRRQLAT